MFKEAYYFPHDSNARNDEKILAIRMKYKWEGYGLYFALVEKLRESSNYECVKDYNVIAYDLRVDTSLIKSIIEDFGLFSFTENGKCFYSESLKKRMLLKDEKSEKARLSAEKRWQIEREKQENANALQTHSDSNAKKRKEKKEEDSKEEDSKEYSRDSDLENSILNYFGFNEYANHDKARAVNEFIACLFNNQSLEAFKAQFTAYRAYKDENGYPHSFHKFIGNQSCLFTDGAWNAENWQKKLTDFKKTAKPETGSEVYVRPKSKKHL